MTIKDALIKYQGVEIDLLLSDVLKKSREFLFMHPGFKLSNHNVKKLLSYISRRKKGEPAAYILGYKDFMGIRFKVNKNVLIPRPETEGLVEKIFNFSARLRYDEVVAGGQFSIFNEPIKILDIGTGSGNIIISLATVLSKQYSVNRIKFYGSDVSKKALAVAKANARENRVKIEFIHSDILKNIRILPDIIVANLPYVPAQDYRRLIKQNLKYEPKRAIFARNNGLALIEKLLKQILQFEKHPLLIFLEFDPRQKAQLSKLIKKNLSGAGVKFHRDLSGRWRYVTVRI